MQEHVIFHDIEGDLITFDTPEGPRHAKRLPMEIALHSDFLDDLTIYCGDLVRDFEQNWDTKERLIHYQPGVKPLSSERLAELLRVDMPLAGWRLARLAADVATSLLKLHDEGIYQTVIGPARIGLHEDRFVLLPSLATMLPPLANCLNEASLQWLPFIDPELLRTRCMQAALLPAGDIFSLGRTLWHLIQPDITISSIEDPFVMAAQIVESAPAQIVLTDSPEFAHICGIITQMCARQPSERPAIEVVTRDFQAAIIQLDPERTVRKLIDDGHLQQADEYLDALASLAQERVFAFPPAKIHLLKARLAMAHTPPQHMTAIDQLRRAKRYEPINPLIDQGIGKIYRQYTDHAQHLKLSESAYLSACRLSQWQRDIVEEWLEVLVYLPPEVVIKRTDQIPGEHRGRQVLNIRASSLLLTGKAWPAWYTCVDYFEAYGYDEQMYETADEASKHIKLFDLLMWRSQRHNIDEMPTAAAIVYARDGQYDVAAELLQLAIAKVGKG